MLPHKSQIISKNVTKILADICLCKFCALALRDCKVNARFPLLLHLYTKKRTLYGFLA